MSSASNGLGYLQVPLTKDFKRKSIYVHRLVIEAFLGKSELDVNHIDHDKSNNSLDNLEYVTKKENINKMLDFYGTAYIKKFCGCGKEISVSTIKCRSCDSVDRLINNLMSKPSLGSLLKDVYSIGYKATGRKYNVSDNTIRKWIIQWHKAME